MTGAQPGKEWVGGEDDKKEFGGSMQIFAQRNIIRGDIGEIYGSGRRKVREICVIKESSCMN